MRKTVRFLVFLQLSKKLANFRLLLRVVVVAGPSFGPVFLGQIRNTLGQIWKTLELQKLRLLNIIVQILLLLSTLASHRLSLTFDCYGEGVEF